MLTLTIYVISILPAIEQTFSLIGTLFLLVSFIFGAFFIGWLLEEKDFKEMSDNKFKEYGIKCFAISCVLYTLASFIPDERSSYIILGTYFGEKIATSEKTNRILDKSIKIIENKLDKILENDAIDVAKEKAIKELKEKIG